MTQLSPIPEDGTVGTAYCRNQGVCPYCKLGRLERLGGNR